MKVWWRTIAFLLMTLAVAGPVLGLAAVPVGEAGGAVTRLQEPVTLVVSILAFLISVGVAIFNWWSWRQKNLEDAKKALTEAVAGMVTARQKLEEFKVTSKEKYGNFDALGYRIALTDQRRLYLSKALQILHRHEQRLSPSYVEYMLLASNLIDLGNTAESVRLYKKSLALAEADNDQVAAASTRRVYGRAQIASGQYDQGREEMLAAATQFQTLAQQKYDRDRMLSDAAETYRRLIWVEIQAGEMESVRVDLNTLEKLVEKVKDPVSRRALNSGLNELRTAVDASTPKENQPPLTGTQSE